MPLEAGAPQSFDASYGPDYEIVYLAWVGGSCVVGRASWVVRRAPWVVGRASCVVGRASVIRKKILNRTIP